ncbi:hypothetical protein HYH02_004962 [Chlamydomonas schloesseri]|uniref:Uncharacterized protein n=1 Tax=Chlamydomonas schloesseri TaxID=2026947 RepID=A0A835WMY9_9CHLO|nr:hypothetical protein HYH02_004962 [Chlamydomonas schloesseri]|eukprot:KAG2450460.1 hypothetical protein HYH02_004962 [Chlamydomonas schloesseri]
MPAALRGYHLPKRRETRASYAHHTLEEAAGKWNNDVSSFAEYQASGKAVKDQAKLAVQNVGLDRALECAGVRAHQRSKAAVRTVG